MRRALLALLFTGAATLTAGVLIGCGGQLAVTPDTGIRIGFVPKALNQEYWVNTAHGAAAGARKARATVLTEAGQADTQVDEQINIVQNLVAEKVSALVTSGFIADAGHAAATLARAAR